MPDPKVLDRVLQTCNYRFRTVQCPRQEKAAEVTAAKWQIPGEQWTPWTIVDCSLLPAGEVWCETDCLKEIENGPR